jgi:hypothetical protein
MLHGVMIVRAARMWEAKIAGNTIDNVRKNLGKSSFFRLRGLFTVD